MSETNIYDTKSKNYMFRALALGQRSAGRTSPRPSVGAVVVSTTGEVVGEGFTQAEGGSHAETIALTQAGTRARNGTIYVTLEPCNGDYRANGERRCSRAILEAGIAEVHYAIADPNPTLGGGGESLRQAGLKVVVGEGADDAAQTHAAFFKWIRTGLPYVILKYAMTLDGKIATHTGDSRWVTGTEARLEVHRLRDESDAILVGVNTILADDPALTTRLPAAQNDSGRAARSPLRIILDSTGRIPLTAQVLNPTLDGQTIIATTRRMPDTKRTQLDREKVDVWVLPEDAAGRVDLGSLLQILGKHELLQLMVEGGGEVLNAFMQPHPQTGKPLADQVWAFIAPKIVGGRAAPGPFGGQGVALMAQSQQLCNIKLERFGDDILVKADIYNNEQ